jgi:mannose-6-phosphate isomerase-like protein (cupin superfamily)
MNRQRNAAALVLASVAVCGTSTTLADQDYRVVTIISAEILDETKKAAPADRVSDQAIRHVKSAQGNLGIGVVHRPVVEAGGPIMAIQHHRQSEVYRVMSGSGTLVTSAGMSETSPLDSEGYIVLNLTGPSDRGIIEDVENSRSIGEGDIVIIPAGVAHGFSEITDAITYMVVRIDPEELVELK